WRVHPLRRRVYRLDARGGSWTPRLPAGYALRPVDAALLADETISNLDWVTEEMVSERPSVDAFLAHSFGYCVQHGRDIVAWCMSEYNSGSRCELGIATAEAHQRRGLARATGTAVIRHALAQGVYDIGWVCAADNAASVATAEALGFRLLIDDTVWWVRG
ncbi:MAG: GNAT family N-acetyltransferase, partial [Anaerolineales bacterium]|nr:GNAT family N-acetyltransferase [Anaerolineales bacterium]